MKLLLVLIVAGMAGLFPVFSQAAQTAQTRLYCQSVRFYQTFDDNDLFSLNLSSFSFQDNGELGPYFYFFDPTTTHSAYLTVEDQLFFDEYPGAMDLDVPSGGDVNLDGFPDFFDVSMDVNASSSGTYTISGIGSGSVSASWWRTGGSSIGNCMLTFHTTSFGNLVFVANFEILEYKGPLSYVPGSNSVTGALDLSQTGNPGGTLQGNVAFTKSMSDRYNQLTLQAGSLSNAFSQILNFTAHGIQRTAPWLTNYYGTFEFTDGEPNTGGADYWIWTLSIDDLNDSDHDGIPDFSDDPVAPAQRPVLTLTRGTTNLWLKITGSVGHLHHIQELTSLSSPNWQTVVSTNLTSNPQTISLPVPVSTTKFWRVITQ
jgi:hypothetical protein